MKKNIIALAIAGALAAPLAAQAEVTVSGGLQAEIVNLSGDGAVEGLYAMDAAEYSSQNSGNFGYLAFSASEDLGNGMKAIAKYNMKTAVDNVLGTRDAYVGMSGGFGTVLAGRLATPYKSSTVKWDPFLATFMQARGSNGMSFLHDGYVDNAVAYANQFGPAKVVLAVVLDEAQDPTDPSSTAGNHATSFSVNVPVGPVEIAVAYIDMSEYTITSDIKDPMTGVVAIPKGTQLADDSAATKVGVKYNAGAITVAGQYETFDDGLGDYAQYYLTGSYAMGATTVSASYGADDIDNVNDNYAAIGVSHAFSKSTNVYAGYRMSDSDVDGTDASAVGAGLRVKF